MRVFFLSLLLGASAHAACTYTAEYTTVNVEWTGFKTTKRVGVSGSFKNVKTKGKAKAPSLAKLLEGMTAKIDGLSVDSGNPERDKNLSEFFFGKLAGRGAIEGKLSGVKAIDPMAERGHATLALKMNHENVETIVSWALDQQGVLEMKGAFDVNAVGAMKSVATLNKACSDLHKGEDGISKTWSEVEFKITARIGKSCR